MINTPFPRSIGTLSQEAYLTLVLMSLVKQAGGELHVSVQCCESLDPSAKISIDWDVPSQQLVIRAASPSLVIAQVRGAGWTTTQPAHTQSQPEASPSSHRVMTEEEILRRLEERMRKDMMRQWREQGAAVVANMPPPDGR